MSISVDEQAVSPRRKRAKRESAEAVRSRRRIGGGRIAAWRDSHYGIVWQRSARIRERSDDAAESRSQTGGLWQTRCRPFATNSRRAATQKQIGVFGRGAVAGNLSEKRSEEYDGSRDPG